VKVGDGSLEMRGTSSAQVLNYGSTPATPYTGNTAVNAGPLILNKAGNAILGTLYVATAAGRTTATWCSTARSRRGRDRQRRDRERVQYRQVGHDRGDRGHKRSPAPHLGGTITGGTFTLKRSALERTHMSQQNTPKNSRHRQRDAARAGLRAVVPRRHQGAATSPSTRRFRGCHGHQPHGYAIWEKMQRELDDPLQGHGTRERPISRCSFPSPS